MAMASKNSCAVLILIILANGAQTALINIKLLESFNLNFKNENLQDPKIAEGCRNRGICNKVINYPENLVTGLLKELNARNVMNSTIERVSDINSYTSMCSYGPMTFPPRAAKDENGNWHYVLNPKSGRPFQEYHIEICRNEGVCEIPLVVQNSYKMYCKQRYAYKPMVYLDIEKQKLSIKNFAVPNCCSCSIRPRS